MSYSPLIIYYEGILYSYSSFCYYPSDIFSAAGQRDVTSSCSRVEDRLLLFLLPSLSHNYIWNTCFDSFTDNRACASRKGQSSCCTVRRRTTCPRCKPISLQNSRIPNPEALFSKLYRSPLSRLHLFIGTCGVLPPSQLAFPALPNFPSFVLCRAGRSPSLDIRKEPLPLLGKLAACGAVLLQL